MNQPTTTQDRYHQMRLNGPIITRRSFQGPAYYVLGHQEARQILGDHKRFVKDPNNILPPEQRTPRGRSSMDMFSLLYDNMLSTDAPDHTRLRALVSKAFTNKRVQELTPRIQEIADQLIDDFQHMGQANLLDVYAFPLPIIVICELLGVPAADRNKFRAWSHAFLGIADSHGYMGSLTDFVKYIGRMITARRKHPQDDLISALVHATEDGQTLTEQELYSMIALLIVAGHETTVNLIGNGMAALLQNPDQMHLLQQNPEHIDTAIEELLRYSGPVEMSTTRYAAENVTISDTFIPHGSPVIIIFAAANLDPTQFIDHNQLDITRANNKHLGFGYGVHYCIGAPLARLEAKIAFNTLLQRIPTIQLAIPASQLTYNNGTIVRGLTRLPVRWNA